MHGAIHAENRVEYHSKHRDGYTPSRHIHKELGDNLQSGFTLDPWSDACMWKKGTVVQSSVIVGIAKLHAGKVRTYQLEA